MTMLNKTHDELNDTVKYLKTQMPGWAISFGYIGNIWQSPYRDDRSWKIWLRPEGIQNSWDYQDCFGINHITNGEDRTSFFDFDEERFFAWVEKQKTRWHDYMEANFVNKMKGVTEQEVLTNMLERFGYHGKDRYYSDKTLYYCFERKNQYGDPDKYTYAKIEFAFDSRGNLVDVRAAT